MKRSIKALSLALLTIWAGSVSAQISTTFPLHEGVRQGVLDNGMHYYILHNEEPKDRASFYFVQNVGAILENDDQDGLAHFLEHMAFNGTKHFEGKGIISFLERHGVRFGYDINAYTSQDQTVYNLSNIPVHDSEGLLDSCLLVLHDWSGYLLLKPEEIEAERGVIREEWRTRRNSQFRLNQQTTQLIFKDSKYAERDVIGELDVINGFGHEALRSYYETWYRPDQQAVVVVGDLDIDLTEQKVKELFSRIPLRENLPEREYFTIPDNSDLIFGTAKDPEAQFMAVMMLYKSSVPTIRNEESFRSSLIKNLYSSMANMRLTAYRQDPDSHSLMLMTGFMPMARLHEAFALQAIPKPGQAAGAYEEIYREITGISRNGFVASELDRAKTQIQSQLDNFFENREQITHDQWATQLGNYFLQGEPVFSPEREYQLSTETLASVTLEEVNAFAAAIQTDHNQVLIVTGPDKEGTIFPTEQELLAVMSQVEASEIEPYVEEVADEPLVADALQAGDVTRTFAIEGISDATGYELSNGVRVILLPTDYEEDQILMSAFSYGGTSKIATGDLASADMSTSVLAYSGLGSFDMMALEKKLSGSIARVNPSIRAYTEGFNGSSNKKDFETLLQLTYLYFTQPRFDEKAFQVLKNQMETLLENQLADNNKALQDTISLLLSNYSDRTILFNAEMLEDLDYETAKKVYLDRFNNIGDFTFVFVGNLEEGSLSQVQKYLGSIPGTREQENYTDHGVRPAKGKSVNHFDRQMEVEKTTVFTRLSGDLSYTRKNSMSVNIIGKLLDKRYMETIREEEGGSYGVSVSSSMSQIPRPEFTLSISFDTDPGKRERLLEVVWNEINQIKDNGPDATDLQDVKSSLIKLRKEQLDKNGFWLGQIQNSQMTGLNYLDLEAYTQLVNSIDEKMIQKTLKKMLKKPEVVEVLMNPKA